LYVLLETVTHGVSLFVTTQQVRGGDGEGDVDGGPEID
jgi:hypothetical protein